MRKAVGVLLRKLKATLGIGSIWGIAAGAVGTVLGGLSGLPTLSSIMVFGVGAGVAGFILGAGFGGLLSVMEGRRTLDELTANRAALWGFVVGTALALVGIIAVASLTSVVEVAVSGLGLPIGVQLTAIAAAAASYGAVTAGLAAATVSLAKRSPSELQSGSDALARDLLVSGEP